MFRHHQPQEFHNEDRKAYFVGGGIGSLSAAFFLIRDGKFKPENITIFEALHVNGGSMDGCGDPEHGYIIRGGRMFNLPTYECLQDMLKDIKSVHHPEKTAYEELHEFTHEYKTHSNSRVVDHNRQKYDVRCMGFDMGDRLSLLALVNTDEDKLGKSKISEHFGPHFFTTNFWYMWATTFAFQPWHSAAEFRRYLLRFMHEFVRIETLEGVARSELNQYDSIILPLEKDLRAKGVVFENDSRVTDVDVSVDKTTDRKVAKSITITHSDGKTEQVNLREEDLFFIQNGSMTDAASVGTHTEPAKFLTKEDGTSWQLWEKLSKLSKDFGDPEPFFGCVPESVWQSFTVTINNDTSFFDQEIAWSGNEPGTGALVTFKDSNWLMSIVVAKQPHFLNQPPTTQVFWGYGLFPDRVGNFVHKRMIDCTGEEILEELIGHLRFDKSTIKNAICRPCIMPFITAQFMCRNRSDRPLPVPKGSVNIAFTSQFVEIPDDVVFTVEYSVRASQTAVYQLCGVKDRKIPRVHHYEYRPKFMVKALIKSFSHTAWQTCFRATLGAAAVGAVAYGVKKYLDSKK